MENSSSRVVLLEIEIIRRKEIFLSIDIHPISNEFYSKRKFWKDGSRVVTTRVTRLLYHAIESNDLCSKSDVVSRPTAFSFHPHFSRSGRRDTSLPPSPLGTAEAAAGPLRSNPKPRNLPFESKT